MATETTLSSNAFNFFNHLQNGVDPRTGLYTFRIDLSARYGDDLLAPEIDLHLSYSALSPHDRGYGHGWRLPTTEFDPARARRIIALANGETFKADGRVGATNQLTMSEKKIDTFHLYEDSDSQWRVVHRSGVVEILQPKGSGQYARAVATRIFSRQGHWLNLEYDTFGGFPMLTRITDMRGATLLAVKREGNQVNLTLPTDLGDATYTLVLGLNNRVDRIELPTDNRASWRFTYLRQRNVDCISSVRTPAGGFEELTYGDDGHAFPIGSGLQPLPRVTRHVQHPGQGQPAIDTRYTYPANGHNFLGGNARLTWIEDGLDNLFRQVIDYDYATTETLWVDGKPVRSTLREFNKFHLNTREALYRGQQLNDDRTEVIGTNVEETTTQYDLKPGRFEEQRNACQLPVMVKKRWWVKDSSRDHVENVLTTYDDYGNVLSQTAATGVVETFTWYRNGQDGYPGNADGFVCDMHTKTVQPATGHGGDAATLVTTHHYKAFEVLASSAQATRRTAWCGLSSEELSTGNAVLRKTTYDYYLQADEEPVADTPLHHGRLKQRTIGFDNPAAGQPGQPDLLETKAGYVYQFDTLAWDTMNAERLRTLPVIDILTTVLTTEGHDKTMLHSREGHSLHSGQALLNIDTDQVERRSVFDALQRTLHEVVAGGTDDEAVRSNAYALCASETEVSSQRFTSVNGVVTQTFFDGAGRTYQQWVSHLDPEDDAKLFLIRELQHDAWGREEEDRQYDWLGKEPFPAKDQCLRHKYLYDSWEGRNVVIRPDTVQEHTLFDPSVEDEEHNQCKTTWLQVAQQTQKSEKLRTWSNPFDKPVRVERLSPDDQVQAELTMRYDGLGRCRSKTDERAHETTFGYDPFGRLVTSELDGVRTDHGYACHSDAQWVTDITVTSNRASEPAFTVGQRQYDGVGRITSHTIGKRNERFEYDSAYSTPGARITGAGDTISYRYNRHLSPFPTHSEVSSLGSEYVYDPVTALMTASRSAEGNRLYTYNVHDQLTAETLETTDEVTRTVHHASTFYNRPTSRIDAGGVSTLHEYDEQGRIRTTTQGNLQATFDYDGLGRLTTVTSLDTGNKSQLVTTLEHDEHGREIKRFQALDSKPQRTQTQTWAKDDLLESRVLSEGSATLLSEVFSYDPRGRLSTAVYAGSSLPSDEAGRSITRQVFRYDSIDNIVNSLSTFADGTSEMARYTYNDDDRFILESLTLTTAGAADRTLTFSHDPNGNLTLDQRGQVLAYDEKSRLVEVSGRGRYRYDAESQLLTSQAGSDAPRQLWFEQNRLSLAIQDGACTRFSFHADMPLAQQSTSGTQTLLLQTNASHSVIAECEAGVVRDIQYSAYGQRHATVPSDSHLGFNGEALDGASQCYLLGTGMRAYNPGLRRFNSPDTRSVFDSGELNPYSYCLNNPIALRDPTGMTASAGGGRPRRPDEDDPNWLGRSTGGGDAMKWVWLAVGVLATIGAVVTAGASLAAVGALGAAAKAAVVAAGAAVAAGNSVGLTAGFLAGYATTSITSAAFATATAALAVGSTVAQTVGAIGNNVQAEQWAMYLGLAGTAVWVGGVARSIGMTAWKAWSSRGAGVAGAGLGNVNAAPTTAQTASAPTAPSGSVLNNRSVVVVSNRFTGQPIRHVVQVPYL